MGKKYSQTWYKIYLLFENNTPKISTKIESGGNEVINGFFVAENASYNKVLISKLKEINILNKGNYLKKITDLMYAQHKISQSKGLIYSAILTCESCYVKLYQEKTDYRLQGRAKIVLNNNGKIYFDTIKLFDNVEEMIVKFNELFYSLVQEVNVLKNTNKVKKIDKISTIIFSPLAAGYFMHEVFGHMLEADLILKKLSIFKEDFLGKKVSTDKLTVSDNPHMHGTQIGLNRFDDEGSLIQPITLINKGKLSGYINNVSTANYFDLPNTSGFARAQSYMYSPLPRMRNTFVNENGDGRTLKNIIKDKTDAIYVDKVYFGHIDTTSGLFMLSCGISRTIVEGKITNTGYGMTIRGDAQKVLYDIQEVGNDLKFSIGLCVKAGQIVTVGMGSPTLVVNNLTCEGDFYE